MKKILVTLALIFSIIVVSAQVEIEKSKEKIIKDGTKYYLHTIEQGHTLYSISKAYEVSIDDIKNANPGLGEKLKLGQSVYIPIIEKDGKYLIYKIKSGDTLYSLLKKHNITKEEFYEINPNIQKNKPLKINTEVKFPIREEKTKIETIEKEIFEKTEITDTTNFIYHVVDKGETLYRLSRNYNVKVDEILENNPEIERRKIKEGQVIKIPKTKTIEQTKEKQIIDSLANVKLKELYYKSDSLDSIALNFINCDTAYWYTYKKDFEIAILLPFQIDYNMQNLYNQEKGNKKQKISDLSRDIISFYSGCLIALEKFKKLDINLNVNVYDIGRDIETLKEIISDGKLSNCDLIIGPAFKSQVEYLNKNLNNRDTRILLPFVSDDDILEKYANNIMLSPTNNGIKDAIVSYTSSFPNKNILIIQDSSSVSIKSATEYQRLFSNFNEDTLNVKIVKYNGKELVSLKSMIEKDKENIFICTFANEAAITQIFINMFPLKDYEITFIGGAAIVNYETVDPQYYLKVKFSYFSHVNVNYSHPDMDYFIESFHKNFLLEPDMSSFMGYDAVNYIVGELLKHGKQFVKCFSEDTGYSGLSGNIKFVQNSNFGKNSFYNSTVYIYTLDQNYLFKQVYPAIGIKIIEEK
jgi:LysM repeat protein